MKFIIEDDSFTYSVDWGKQNKIVDGFQEEYFPSCKESVEALMRLLTNIYPSVLIADVLHGELDAKDYSESKRDERVFKHLDDEDDE